jgi:hypothetical protein
MTRFLPACLRVCVCVCVCVCVLPDSLLKFQLKELISQPKYRLHREIHTRTLLCFKETH